jgi:hypothetical protein
MMRKNQSCKFNCHMDIQPQEKLSIYVYIVKLHCSPKEDERYEKRNQ